MSKRKALLAGLKAGLDNGLIVSCWDVDNEVGKIGIYQTRKKLKTYLAG